MSSANDDQLMKQAIEWAKGCNPRQDAIPKVGAIIAVGSEVIGHGRRGTGILGDDRHAEWDALGQVQDKNRLPHATLYTTLEPCTGEVRTRPLEACTELILQHRIRRVVIGILDPNQGVTGKGLWKLQDAGVDVSLFPHELAQEVRALNAGFIRYQRTLGAKIISPTPGEELHTYLTHGVHPIRFTCVNPPIDGQHFLLVLKNGLCWPQGSAFRPVDTDTYEVDAHFGSTGEHTLHLVTAVDLGINLITYYRRVIDRNARRRSELEKVNLPKDHPLLREGDRPGIPMTDLPKGLRSEASVKVTIAAKPIAAE
jgi:pyrimidine deaminase RibD-like protein